AGPAVAQTADAGLQYGNPDGSSGPVKDGVLIPRVYPDTTLPVYVFSDGLGNVLHQPTSASAPTDAHQITAGEAKALETSALNTAFASHSAIRRPFGTFAQVAVSIVDLDGNILAQAGTPDAPTFSADTSLQKARSAVFFSRTGTPNAQNQVNGITALSP